VIFLLKIIAFSTCWFNNIGATGSNWKVIQNLIEDRKIIIAENKPLRETYQNDESNISLYQLNSLLNYARKNGLTIDMDNQLPAIVGESNPENIDSIHFAFATKEEIKNNTEWNNYLTTNLLNDENFSIKYGDINENLFGGISNFPKGTEISVVENFFDGYVKWAKRITIWDPYMLESNNIEGTIRFLDFINENNLSLKQIKFVTKPNHKHGTNDDEKKNYFRDVFKSRIRNHPIFENIELVEIGWQGNAQRYLSFGNDGSEITLSFSGQIKSISELFLLRKGRLTSKNFSYSLLEKEMSSELIRSPNYEIVNLEK
jgi:hypothetical protein